MQKSLDVYTLKIYTETRFYYTEMWPDLIRSLFSNWPRQDQCKWQMVTITEESEKFHNNLKCSFF